MTNVGNVDESKGKLELQHISLSLQNEILNNELVIPIWEVAGGKRSIIRLVVC